MAGDKTFQAEICQNVAVNDEERAVQPIAQQAQGPDGAERLLFLCVVDEHVPLPPVTADCADEVSEIPGCDIDLLWPVSSQPLQQKLQNGRRADRHKRLW